MHLFNKADVVDAYYSWVNKEGSVEGGYRPVIIKDILPNQKYKVVKISRSNKAEDLIRIKVNSREWREMGLYDLAHDSFIDKKATNEIGEDEINEKLGTCPVVLICIDLIEKR